MYPQPLLGKTSKVPRKYANKTLGFALQPLAAPVTPTTITFGTTTVTVTPDPGVTPSVTGDTLFMPPVASPGSSGYQSGVSLTYSPPATLVGLTVSIPRPSKGQITLDLVVIGPDQAEHEVSYSLVAPLPLKGPKVYGGAAVFGGAVKFARVRGTEMSAGAKLVLSDFDASSTIQPFPQLV